MTLGELKARLKKNENEERPTITTLRTSEDKIVVQTARIGNVYRLDTDDIFYYLF